MNTISTPRADVQENVKRSLCILGIESTAHTFGASFWQILSKVLLVHVREAIDNCLLRSQSKDSSLTFTISDGAA